MTPTIFRHNSFRFFFFSREETRMHVHVSNPAGDAKFWLEPEVALAASKGLSAQQLAELASLITAHQLEINDAGKKHFPDSDSRS